MNKFDNISFSHSELNSFQCFCFANVHCSIFFSFLQIETNINHLVCGDAQIDKKKKNDLILSTINTRRKEKTKDLT